MGTDRSGESPTRYATREELEGYIGYHKDILLENVRGLRALEISEDEQGVYVSFKMGELTDADADRPYDIEQAAGAMSWPGAFERIRARVVPEPLTSQESPDLPRP